MRHYYSFEFLMTFANVIAGKWLCIAHFLVSQWCWTSSSGPPSSFPSQAAFPSLKLGVLPWTYMEVHHKKKSHNTCLYSCSEYCEGFESLWNDVFFRTHFSTRNSYVLLILDNVELIFLSFFFFALEARKFWDISFHAMPICQPISLFFPS